MLRMVLVVAALMGAFPVSHRADAADIPIQGRTTAGTALLDEAMLGIMKEHRLPGGVLAIARSGRLVVSRGYGQADVASGRRVQPDTPFRLASLTKPVTAITLLSLAERGRLSLIDPIEPLLRRVVKQLPRTPLAPGDLTVAHLMRHTAGWGPTENPAVGGWDATDINRYRVRLGREPHGIRELIVAAWTDLTRTEPGTRFAYSTFGLCVAGLVAEAAGDQPLQELWRSFIFRPLGLLGPYLATAERIKERPAPGEARYHDFAGAPEWTVDTPTGKQRLPRPDAYWEPLTRDTCVSGGRLVASAPDYLAIMLAAGRRREPFLLSERSAGLLFSDGADVDVGTNRRLTYGLFVRMAESGQPAWWHTGGIPGTVSYYARHDTIDLVVAFNSRPSNNEVYPDLARRIWQAIERVSAWPSDDLFEARR